MILLGKCIFLNLALLCGALSSLHGGEKVDPCPIGCACSGNPDARRVDCSNLNLTTIPAEIGPRTAIIDLSWNSIKELSDRAFSHLPRLQELNMANNLIDFIPDSAFLKLSTLRSLHLQNNKFQSIPTRSFQPLVNLENLYLSFNQLSPVPEHSFSTISRILKLSLDGNSLLLVPVSSLVDFTRLEFLNLASNSIKNIPDYAFQNLKKLSHLCLKHNHIEYVGRDAFEGLISLKVLEINGNQLLELPQALASLPLLEELSFADNKIRFLAMSSFLTNRRLTALELSGNPIESVDKKTFSNLPYLKKLTLSEARLLEEFPDIKGTSSLEHLRIDRAKLSYVPDDLCITAPSLRSLDLKSNKLTRLPYLRGCKDLRLIDLSYNLIVGIDDHAFVDQINLVDLFLGHNLITRITHDSFEGLVNLHVLDMERNEIEDIHPDAFIRFKDLRDLNLGANKFPKLPTKGLEKLRHIKTFNNRELKEFPPVKTFPRIQTLALSYAYHCCEFMQSTSYRSSSPKSSTPWQETIVWVNKEEVDMSSWSANISELSPGIGNFSTKFGDFANQLWKSLGRDYAIPDNLASYAEEYFEDYKSAFATNEDNPRFILKCLPEPGPFMPCEDLFGWWSLRCGIWVVFLLAVLGNGIVVIVLIIGRSKIDVPRFLVCNLAAADFFMGVYLGILAVVDASTLGEFKVSAIKWQTSIGCEIAGFLAVLSSELSVFTLAVITLERNYAITHAMRLNKRLSLRHAGYIMFIGWTFAIAMAALPLVGISDFKKFAICLPFETEDVYSLTYVVFLILINGLAFLILMGCYLKMYCVIRGSSAWNSNDSRIARRMALLVFTDFICWAPIAFFSLTAVCGFELISLEEAKVFAIFVLPLNSCANPFLYAIFTKQFKKDCIHICKRIEESRVTRGIGRGRHSSNFSNRHTPVTTNSAAQAPNPGSEGDQQRCRNASTDMCHCSKTSWKSKDRQRRSWKEWACKYILCRRKQSEQNRADGYTYAIAQIQKNLEKRNKHTSISSENFSSRSDSWRQGSTIPLRLLDQDVRRGSWSLQRKISEDSNMSCSRQDSSTSTFHMSRSSFSSDSSSQPRTGRPLLGTAIMNNRESVRSARENKPKLCRQSAIVDEKSQSYNKQVLTRKLSKEKSADELCPVCAKKEGFKSKELEEKFACFYNRLVESSYGESSEYTSKEDQIVLSSDIQSVDARLDPEKVIKETSTQRPRIEVNPMAESKDINFSAVGKIELTKPIDSQHENISEHPLHTKDHANEKCKSLMNINAKSNPEKTKKSSSDNALVKLSLSNLPVIFKSFPSHDAFNEKRTGLKTNTCSSTIMRSSKSENVVPDCASSISRTLTVDNHFNNQGEAISTDHLRWGFLPTMNKSNDLKVSSSSPNITVKSSETSPLIDNNEE